MQNSVITQTPMPEAIDPPDGASQMTNLTNNLERYAVGRFASTAARDSAIPAPVVGMLCYVTGTGLMLYEAGAWKIFGPRGQLGYWVTNADQTGIQTTRTDINQLNTGALTIPAGRRIELTAMIKFFKAGIDQTGWITCEMMEGATPLYGAGANGWAPAPGYSTVTFGTRIIPSAGSHTYKVTAWTSSGYVNIGATSTLSVDDIGPA